MADAGIRTSTTEKRFRLLRRLGEGGMGVVHEAFDTERNERLALKILRNTSADSLVRFKREFRSLQDLHHPNLVTLGELIFEEGEWLFTMELVDGEDFLTYVAPAMLDARGSDVFRVDDTLPAMTGRAGAPRRSIASDVQRLRASLAQLASGLVTLHDAGKVHRDIKPSNVLVARDGRVVILDFGLVTDTQGDAHGMTDLDVVGTPAYMAPEQAASKPIGPPADWYAVGVLLFEALTGEVPFTGAPLDVLLRKQQDEPPPPRKLVDGVPPDLDALCAGLLRFDPAARPSGRAVLRALDARPRASSHSTMASMTAHASFVGRDEELETLRSAYATARSGQAVSVFVYGESGIGKSCLVRHFTDVNIVAERDLVLLSGRCYEREAVPYKAFDGVVDALSRFMARLPATEVMHLLPHRPASLLQLFPVLRRVEGITQSPHAQPSSVVDPHELRARAFAAIRELFTRLADRRPVIVVIDDMQWADADSVALLGELLRPPDAPALLFVATVRDVPVDGTAVARVVRDPAEALKGDVRRVFLGRLSQEHGRELARRLVLQTAPELPVSVETIAEEADGHPLFIDEIVRHLFLVGAPAATTLRLDDALWGRIEALDAPARRLVEVVAVAGAPLPQDIAGKAAGTSAGAELSKLTSFLRVAHLVRTSGTRGADAIEPYHGRIREAVMAKLGPAAQRAIHKRIALALATAENADHEALATHWEGAGDLEAAAKHLVAAADRALDALAFDRAAKLYGHALSLRVFRAEGRTESGGRKLRDDERQLRTRLADALAKSGRGMLAAKAYREAATLASPTVALDLERRAAEQLLRSGQFDEGLAAIKGVLASIGMPLPNSSVWVIFAIVFWRIVLRVRGLGYRETDSSHVSERDLLRLDVLWSSGNVLTLVEPVLVQLSHARHMNLALQIGEPYRVARALAIEVLSNGALGGDGWRRTSMLIERARAVAEGTGSSHAIGWARATAGAAHYLAGRFKTAFELCVSAEEVFRNETSVEAGEISSMQLFTLQALAHLGELQELVERGRAALREATTRGDVYASVNLRIGHPNFAWLVRGDPDGARREVHEAMRQWAQQGFHLEHYYEIYALTNADLYAGDPDAAYARIAARWRSMHTSLLTRVQAVRIYSHQLRARAALAVAAKDEGRRREMLRIVARDARAMERERMPWATALAALLRAGIARVRGDHAEAIARLASAADRFDAVDMKLYAAVARHCLGSLQGGHGQATRAAAVEWMRAQTVQEPDRIVATLAPGCVT